MSVRFYDVLVKVSVRSNSVAEAVIDVEKWMEKANVANRPSPVSGIRVLGCTDVSDKIMGGKEST